MINLHIIPKMCGSSCGDWGSGPTEKIKCIKSLSLIITE